MIFHVKILALVHFYHSSHGDMDFGYDLFHVSLTTCEVKITSPKNPQKYWDCPAGTCGKGIISPLPIGSTGRTVYLPTWMVGVYGKCRVVYIQISHNLRTMVNGSLPAGHPSRVYRGWNPTQLCGDYFTKKLYIRIPTKQPGFNGK